MRASIPGNILLFGEYAVLEEGGLGIALAVDRRVLIAASPSVDLRVEGLWIGGSMRWTPEDPSASPYVSAAVRELENWLTPGRDEPSRLTGRIVIDSSELSQPEGRKSGFGSSAAVVLGTLCALLVSMDRAEGVTDGTLLRLALAAHRQAQGGSGSGYDVYCSFHGGLGLFRGGPEPSWQPCALPWVPDVRLFTGPAPVSTPDAIGKYRQWKERDPAAAQSLLEESNRAILSLLHASSAREAGSEIRACRDVGVAIGDAIGVEARIPAPHSVDPDSCKSLGAGNELGAFFLLPGIPNPPHDPGLRRVSASTRGIEWTR